MVCPCRVVLAAISAFVAVFLVWHTTRDSAKPADESAGDQPDVAKVI